MPCPAPVSAAPGARTGTHGDTDPGAVFAPCCVLRWPRGAPTGSLGCARERVRQFHPTPAHTALEYRSRTVLFAACPGFVSEVHCPEPFIATFIATVWGRVPGPAPCPAEGLAKSYGCALQLQGGPPCRSKGRRTSIPALKPGREAEFSDSQSQANNYRQSYHKVVSTVHQAQHPAPAQIRANPTKAA